MLPPLHATPDIFHGFYTRTFHRAAFTHDQRCINQPIKKIHAIPAPIKKIIAASRRPCTNWPSPGQRKLHNAAITFPAEPCPSLMLGLFSYQQAFFKPIRAHWRIAIGQGI